MEHHTIRHKLSDYIDGAVTPDEQTAIEEHLKTCTQCTEALTELRKAIEHLQHVEEVESPAWLTQKIMARVRAEGKKSIFRKLFFPLHIKLPVEAVAVAFLTVTAFYLYQGVHTTMQVAQAPKEETALQQKAVDKQASRPLMKESTPLPPPAPAPAKAVGGAAREKMMQDKDERYAAAPQAAAPAGDGAALEAKRSAPARAGEPQAAMPAAGLMMAKEQAQSEAQPPAFKAKTPAKAEKKGSGILTLSVRVQDLQAAGKDIEKTITQLSGKIIKTKSEETRTLLLAELDALKLKELFEKLKSLGELREKELPLSTREGQIQIRIEVAKLSAER